MLRHYFVDDDGLSEELVLHLTVDDGVEEGGVAVCIVVAWLCWAS